MPVEVHELVIEQSPPEGLHPALSWHDAEVGRWRDLPVLELWGEERIGQPYAFRVHVQMSGDLPALGADATLSWRGRHVCAQIDGVYPEESADPDGSSRSFVEIALGPPVGDANRNRRSALFTDENLAAIVKQVFERPQGAAFNPEAAPATPPWFSREVVWRTVHERGHEEVRRVTVQLAESDLAFVARQLEALGLAYHFENEPGRCRMVITDSDDLRPQFAEPFLRPVADDGVASARRLLRLRTGRSALPANIRAHRLRVAPEGPLNETSDMSLTAGSGGYDACRFEEITIDESAAGWAAERVKQRLARRLQGDAERWQLEAAWPGLEAGSVILVEDSSADMPRPVVLTCVRHRIDREHRYRASAEATPSLGSVGYVPPLVTPRPRLDGLIPVEVYDWHVSDDGRFEGEAVLPFSDWTKAWVPLLFAAQSTESCAFLRPERGVFLCGFIGGDPELPYLVGQVPNGVGNDQNDHLVHVTTTRGDQLTLGKEVNDQLHVHTIGPVKVEIEGDSIHKVYGKETIGIDGELVATAGTIALHASTIHLLAGRIVVDTGLLRVTGALRCQTLIADAVVGSSYTPGAGNIW